MNRHVYEELREFVRGVGRIAVVKAPPGSGKSYNLLEALDGALTQGKRIAIVAQTNNQIDDLCERFCKRFPEDGIVRFSGESYERPDTLPDNVSILGQLQNWGLLKLKTNTTFSLLTKRGK